MNEENKSKLAPDNLSGLTANTAAKQKEAVPQKSEFKLETKLPDTESVNLPTKVEEQLSISKPGKNNKSSEIAYSPAAERVWSALNLQPKLVKEFPAHSQFIIKFIYLVIAYIICLFFIQSVDGLKLSSYSAMSGWLSPINYVETQLDYADYLSSIGNYVKATSIYTDVINKIKKAKMSNQLLSLTEVKLSLANSVQVYPKPFADRGLIKGLDRLGNPSPDTPKTLVESLRKLGEQYEHRKEPYIAYAVFETASRFWKTGPTTQSEGNTFADLGELFEAKADWAYVYKCYAHAYAITKSWGDADYNTYRLAKMALAKNNLGEKKEATELFKQAIEMDERVHRGGLSWSQPYLQIYINNLKDLKRFSEAESVRQKHPI